MPVRLLTACLRREEHDDRVAHDFQLQLLTRLQQRLLADEQTAGGGAKPRRLALGLEMFERDVQGVMDEYLAGPQLRFAPPACRSIFPSSCSAAYSAALTARISVSVPSFGPPP